MSDVGVIKQIIGAVIDVEFDKENIPNIYDALVVEENNLVLETQQQLGDGIVRTVAMGTTEGLKRGLNAKNTKAPGGWARSARPLGRCRRRRVIVFQCWREFWSDIQWIFNDFH